MFYFQNKVDKRFEVYLYLAHFTPIPLYTIHFNQISSELISEQSLTESRKTFCHFDWPGQHQLELRLYKIKCLKRDSCRDYCQEVNRWPLMGVLMFCSAATLETKIQALFQQKFRSKERFLQLKWLEVSKALWIEGFSDPASTVFSKRKICSMLSFCNSNSCALKVQ